MFGDLQATRNGLRVWMQHRLVRRPLGEVKPGHSGGWIADAVVDDDPDQFGERERVVTCAAERGAVRGPVWEWGGSPHCQTRADRRLRVLARLVADVWGNMGRETDCLHGP